MNSASVRTPPLYCSWKTLVIFIILIIFEPPKLTFYAIRPSDCWLLICLLFQYINGYNIILPFRNRFLVKNYGLFIGILAFIATLIQASSAGLTLDISFIFEFYRFLRFLLIFKLVENILNDFTSYDAARFWRVYTLMGITIMVLSFLEYNSIQPFKQTIMDLYYERPQSELEDYLIKVDRLAGVMGNPNTTAMLFVTTLTYPLLKIGSKGNSLINRLFYTAYILAAIYVLLVMTGSRTSILALAVLFAFILLAKSNQLKELMLFLLVLILFSILAFYLYQHFKSEAVIQNRITEALSGKNSPAPAENKFAGRYVLWQDRFKTFANEGNPLALLIGLGYTKAYPEYADNGFISAFINNGLIGLILKLFVFYIFITSGFIRAIIDYRHSKLDSSFLAIALSAFALIIWEFTADLTEHYKLGQLFYLFLSMIMIINPNAAQMDNDLPDYKQA